MGPRIDEWVDVSGQTMEHEIGVLQRMIGDLPYGAVIVELGVCQARSTCGLALACEGTGKHVYAIDDFNPRNAGYVSPSLERTVENVKRLRLNGHITILVGDSTGIGLNWSLPVDLIFHDASHLYDKVLEDIKAWLIHLKKGGLFCFHDYTGLGPGQIGVSKAANELLGEPVFITNRLGVFKCA
jgi:hypothetical protein